MGVSNWDWLADVTLEPADEPPRLEVGDVLNVMTPGGVTKVRVTEAEDVVDDDGEMSRRIATEPA